MYSPGSIGRFCQRGKGREVNARSVGSIFIIDELGKIAILNFIFFSNVLMLVVIIFVEFC